MASNKINVNLAFNAETGKAKKQIQDLQVLLNKIAYSGATAGPGQKLSADLQKASEAAKQLQIHLNNAFNTKTGNFDLSLFNKSLKDSKTSVSSLSADLLKAGQTGQQAFLGLAQSISLADQPMLKISNRLKDFGISLKNAVKWQLSSSIIHGFMGGLQSAYGYAQDLNESLNNIRIVTGYNVDKMAEFADYANKAAKALSTTTTEYTDASLIYFQQGLSDADVKKRTDTTIKLANVTGQSVEETANQMTAIWNNFDDGSKSLEYYADVITALGAATASSSKEISEGLNKFSAVAESVGLSYEYASAALATVTATTRQSADVVGNAFKTLFARIQGLNLGETLDDGTTLNKYSEALFKVGINIKDQSGQLKDMNTILNELGSKWQTIGKDQQIALAETVAGVRQYTQLIALMDNWDYFKQNLGVATGSEGELTKQANIYEEGWKASIKRVEAAKEAVFKDLIDENFFIGVNNSLTTLLTGVHAFIDGFGGIKSILLSISSIIINSFSNKIPEAIQTVRYNLSLLSKEGTDKVYKKIADGINKVSNEMFQLYEQSQGKQGISPDSSIGVAIQQANDLTMAKNKLASVNDKLSTSEKQYYQSNLSIIELFQQETLSIKKNNEELQKTINLQEKQIKVVDKNSINKISIPWDSKQLENIISEKDLNKAQDAIKRFQDSFTKAKQSIVKDSNEITKKLLELAKPGSKIQPIELKELNYGGVQESIKQIQELYKVLSQGGNISSDGLELIKTRIQSISNLIPQTVQEVTGLKDIFNNIFNNINNGDSSGLGANLDNLVSKLGTAKISGEEAIQILRELNGSSFDTLLENYDILNENTEKVEKNTSMLKQLIESFNPQHVVKVAEALGSLAGLAGSIVSVGRGLSSIITAFSDEDLSIWQKFSTLLFGISMIVPGITSGLQSYYKIVNFLTNAKKTEVAVETASNAQKKISTALTAKEVVTEKAKNAMDIIKNNLEKASVKNKSDYIAKAIQKIAVENQLLTKDQAAILYDKIKTKGRVKSLELTEEEIIKLYEEAAAQEAANKAKQKSISLVSKGSIVGLVAIGLITAAIAAYSAYREAQKKKVEAQKEEIQKLQEENNEKKEEIKQNNDLIKSYNSLITSYEEMKVAVDDGTASHSDLLEVQNNLKEKALEVAEALGIEGAAFAALTGNYSELTKEITRAQAEKVFDAYKKEKVLLEQQSSLFDLDDSYIPTTLYGDESIVYAEANPFRNDFLKESYGETISFNYADENLIDIIEDIIDNKDLSLFINELNWLVGEAEDASLASQMEVYEQYKKLYEAILLNDDYRKQFKDTDEFSAIEEYINGLKETYDSYIATENNMLQYSTQLAAFSNAQNITDIDFDNLLNPYDDIKSVKDFDDYANEMAKTIARWKGVAVDDTILEDARNYLGSLEGKSEFKLISDSLKTAAEKLDRDKKEVIDFYQDLSPEQQTLFFSVDFDLYQSDMAIKNQIAFLQEIADNNSIKLKADLVSQGKELISSDKTTTKDLISWWNQISEQQFDENSLPEDFPKSTEEFLALTQDQQLQLVETLNKLIIPEKQEDINSDLESIKKRLDINSKERDYRKQAIEALEKQQQFTKEQAQEIIDSGNTSDPLYTPAKVLLELYDQIDALDRETTGLIKTKESLEAEQEALEYTWRETLQEEAESLDIDYNRVKEYAQYLRKINDGLDIQTSEEMALVKIKEQQAIDGLTQSAEKYLEVLNKYPDGIDDNIILTNEERETLDSLATSFANLLGVEKDVFSAEFIATEPIRTALKAIQDGAKGAYEQLYLLLTIQANSKDEVYGSAIEQLGTALLNANDIKEGEIATGNEYRTIKEAYKVLVSSGENGKEIADDMLKKSGWAINEYGDFIRTNVVEGLEDWQLALKDSAEAVGLNYTEVQKYAKILKELNDSITDQEAEEMALAWMNQTTAIDKLNSGAKKYAEILAIVGKEGTDVAKIDWLNTYQELQQYFAMLAGTDLDKAKDIFNADFIQSDEIQQVLQDMADDVEGAYGRLFGIVKAQALGLGKDALSDIIKISSMDLEVGVNFKIDNDSVIKSLYDALKNKLNPEEIKEFFRDSFNLELEIDGDKLVSATKTGTEAKKTIEDLAKEANIAYEDVQDYAKILIQAGRATEETAEAMALSLLKQSKGFDELSDKAEEYVDNLKGVKPNEITSDQSKYINDLADSLALLIGVEKEAFGDNLAGFIASDAVMTAIEELNNGVDGSIEKLILLASLQASGFSVNKNGEVENSTKLTDFSQQAIEASQNMGVGDTNSNLFEALDELEGEEYEAALQSLKALGFEIKDESTIIRTSLIPALTAGKSAIEKLSESLGVSYDTVKKNAETLRTLYPALKDNTELSERMALAELAQSEAVKDLTDNYQNYIDTLNTATYGSDEYVKAYQALADNLSKITGITDANILDNLINDEEIKNILSRITSGEEGTADELRIAVATKFIINNDEYDSIETELLNLLKDVIIDVPIGFTFEEGSKGYEVFKTLYEKLGGNEEAKSLFRILGISITETENEGLEFTKITSDILAMTESIKDQAEAFGISYEEVQDYAKILRENNEVLKDQIELSEKIALAEKKQAKGADDLIDNYEDYVNILKKAQLDKRVKDTEEYAKAITNLRKDLSLLTGYEEDIFTTDFINSDEVQQALLDISNGVEGATERLKALSAIQELKIKANIEIDENSWNELTQAVIDANSQDIEIGAYIDNTAAFDSLLGLMEQAGYTTDQIQEFFNNLGWSPELSYKEIPVSSLNDYATNGYVDVVEGNIIDGYKIVRKPISAYNGVSENQMVRVPIVGKSLGSTGYRKIDPPGNSSSKKPSTGGGGGGGAPKHAEKKNDSDKTRYHTLQNQLEDLKAEYDSISEAADRAFGKDKLKAIDSEISKTDELINKQKEYVDAIKANLPIDKAVMDAYYTDLIGGNIQYDERGNISNYDAIQDAMFNKYNQMADMYDEDSQEWQVFEKKYEQLEKYIEQYEETYDLLRDEEEAYQDLLRQRIDLKLAKVQYSIEVQLEIPDNEIAVLEYKLGKIEDDAFKSAEAIGLLTKKAEAVYDQIQINKQGLNDILKLSLSTQEILQLMSGDTSILANKTFTADQIEAIKQYRDSLLDLNSQFDDIRSNIEDKVMEVFDAWNEKLDSGISKLDHYGSILESYKNIVDIVGKDTLGLTDTFMATLNQSSIDNAINKVNATKKSYDTMLEAQNKAEQALEDAKKRNDEASIKMWEENLKSITEEAESAREEMLSAWEEALSGIAEQFEATVERVVDIFNKEVYKLGGLEGLSEDFSRQQENADIMLDDYQKIYELSKLNRDINKSINDIDSLSGKQKLKKLLEQINALQEDGLEMSQYDLEYLQKTYDLRLAEIELEEARNAKNTVRLRKDNEGNWSYVYTQNMDAVDTAQQKYEDALYAMQEVSSNYIDEMSEKLISTSQEMEEALAAIRIQDFASIDDYYAEVQRVQQQYEEELLMQQNELQKAIDNNKILYDQDWTNYHNATGYKISDTENFATTFRDTLLGSLLGSEEDTANFTDIIGSAVNTLTQGLMTGAEIYYANLEAAMNAAGTSTGNFAEDTATNIDAVVEKSIEGAEAIDQMAIEMIDAFSEITSSVQNWQESYGTAMQAIIDSNLAVIESFNQMLEALSIDPNSITVRYDLINSNNAPQQFASGGYTGEWGNYGKLAILDEKELILNQNDTTNFLKALGIAQTILDTIDLNATQASYGFGNLVPATINENNSQTIEQDVHITAEFPNAIDKNEIEQAFETLINKASQYANRR